MGKAGKIICAGLGRTGTTSLSQALNILGYKTQESTGHWYWVRLEGENLVFVPNRAEGDQYDAYADSPVPLVYQDLVDLYPGSKVILTTRSLDGWLPSTEKLMNAIQSFAAASADPNFSLEVVNTYHEKIYGSASFDRDLFAASYQKHVDEVRTFFRTRSEPVLEIQLSGSGLWEQLCEFLGEPIPAVPFPWRNKTTPSQKLAARFASWFGRR